MVNRIMENALPTFLPPSAKQQESPVRERQEQREILFEAQK